MHLRITLHFVLLPNANFFSASLKVRMKLHAATF